MNNFKPFKDIAIGLAQNGIATLRYEKRTLNYKTDSLSNTPTKEVVIDAVNLYKKALQMPEIDKESIYILGHSLGGLMAPKIAEQCSGLKGIILMAAPANKLEDIILEQYTYILSLDSLDADEKRKLADLKQQVNRVKNNEYNLQTPNEKLPLQISATYWQDLANYKPLQSNFIQTHKVLVLNGGKDYQVTKTDFETWKQTLQNNKQAVFKFYPTLFHLFAIGNATPNDYEQVSNVQEEVITDIVKFIH
ncbi:MAG: alpha/beta hydrolase [Bacteroidia bacterium]|nr:alpha/beta hydrolase [Bacteroidia bacterium]